jgi:hypothetical protein
MLFLGASMCITASPMLARIIHYKKLSGTSMGTIAIGAGAIDDATAWCLLAVVLASVDRDWSHAWQNIGGGAGFVLVAFLVLKPLLNRLKYHAMKDGELTESGLAAGLTMLATGAWFTDWIGLHGGRRQFSLSEEVAFRPPLFSRGRAPPGESGSRGGAAEAPHHHGARQPSHHPPREERRAESAGGFATMETAEQPERSRLPIGSHALRQRPAVRTAERVRGRAPGPATVRSHAPSGPANTQPWTVARHASRTPAALPRPRR